MGYKDWLERNYYRYRAHIPGRMLYHPDYFMVQRQLAGSPQQIAALAEQRLRAVLSHAVQWVPYYRERVRLSAGELAHEPPLALLQRFPWLEKSEIMARQRDFLDARLRPERLNYVTSGGSSGQGIGLWRNKRLADIEKAFFMYEWGKFGFRMDKSRFLRIGADARRLNHEPPTRVVGNRLMLSPYHLAERHTDAILAALAQFRPDYVHAYPSSAAALAELLEARGQRWPVRAVLLASEPATLDQLAMIARVFQAPISVNYGLTERTNLAFADYRDGQLSPYRFSPLYGVSENRSAGGKQEIVGTSLWNDVMPLIRYCTNDFGAIDAAGQCTSLDGRDQEFLIDRSGNRIPGLSIVIDEVTWDFVRLYQIRQQTPGRIRLVVVPRHGALLPEQAHFVLDAQLKRWGSFFDIELEQADDIPVAANGKRRLVVSEVGV